MTSNISSAARLDLIYRRALTLSNGCMLNPFRNNEHVTFIQRPTLETHITNNAKLTIVLHSEQSSLYFYKNKQKAMDISYYLKHAAANDAQQVASQVILLLCELDNQELSDFDLDEYTEIAKDLINSNKITAVIAYNDEQPVGLLTLNQCSAVYNKGDFGEICELYVTPSHRSSNIGQLLLNEASEIAKQKGWGTIEVGAPSYEEWARTISFYKKNGYKEIGPRLYIEL